MNSSAAVKRHVISGKFCADAVVTCLMKLWTSSWFCSPRWSRHFVIRILPRSF